MSKTPPGVFLNCPFDDAYVPLLSAMIFTTVTCGFQPRSALEDDGAGLMRFDRLCSLVRSCDIGIHDLSRTESSTEGLPRFNMPLELGLFLGARAFGGPRQKQKATLLLVKDHHTMGRYLSDLASVDPVADGGTPHGAVEAVRGFFQRTLVASGSARRLPGAVAIHARFVAFQKALPKMAKAGGFASNALDPLKSYVDYNYAVLDFLSTDKD